jgi:hypothetical protein
VTRPIKVEFLGDTKGIDDSVNDVNSKLGKLGTGAKVAAGTAGAAAGGALALGLKNSLEIGEAQAKLQAQLGTSGPLFEDAGEIAGNLYANAYGDSLEQVGDAVRNVITSGALDMSTATNEEIQSIAGQAMSLSQVFGVDVTESMRAVGNMVKTGITPNAQEAMDVLTAGFQKLGPQAQDVLDSFTEYSIQFAKVGIDAKEGLGMVSQMMDAGARDTDVAADALKEFAIRVVNGTDKTKNAMQAIGLSADDMAHKFMAGGKTADDALQLVVTNLKNIPDPVKRSQVAVELFGTQAEDLAGALFAIDPAHAVAALGAVGGAAAKMDAAIGDTAQAKITAMQRGFEMWTASIVSTQGPLGNVAAGVMAFAPGGLDIAGNLGMMAVAFRGVGIASLFTAGGATAAWVAITGPVGLVIGAIALVAAGVYLIYTNWETITGFFSGLWGVVTGIFSGSWGAIGGVVQGGIDRAKGAIFWFAGLPGLIGGWFGGMVGAAAGKVNELIGWVGGIPGRAMGALGNLGGMLFGSGIALISGFLDGLVSRWNQLMAWARNAMASLRALWPFSPAKDGPFSGRGYVTYSGQALTSDFARSIVAGMPTVLGAVDTLMGATQGAMNLTPLAAVSTRTGSGSTAPAGDPIVLRGDGTALSELLIEVLRKAINGRGGDVQKVLGR